MDVPVDNPKFWILSEYSLLVFNKQGVHDYEILLSK